MIPLIITLVGIYQEGNRARFAIVEVFLGDALAAILLVEKVRRYDA